MRKFLSFSACFIGLISVFAQNIVFADSNFKNLLATAGTTTNQIAKNTAGNYIVIDTNADGEISLTEALPVAELEISNGGINSVEGIRSFAGLQRITVQSNLISVLDLHDMPLLKYVTFAGNTLSTLNVSGATGLLECFVSDSFHLTTADFSTNLNLQKVGFNYTTLTSLNLVNHNFLQTVSLLSNYNLSSLDVMGCAALHTLVASGSILTSLNLVGLSNITHLDVHNNELTTLNLQSQNNLAYLSVSHNFDLTSLYIKNGAVETLVFQNTPSLAYICADQSQIAAIQNTIANATGSDGYNSASVVDSSCSSVLSVIESNSKKEFRIAPNPTTDFIRYSALKSGAKLSSVSIYDNSGRVVFKLFNPGAAIDVSFLSGGNYFAVFQFDDGSSKATQFLKK